jgi:tetratricopeptide (TPR) repeat protein
MSEKPFRARKASGLFMLLVMIVGGAVFVYWRTGVEDFPGDYEVRKGNYRLEDKRYEEAVAEFSGALGKNPDHVGAHHGLAVTYLQMGRFDEAIAEFSAAIDLDPDFAIAYADRGVVYDQMGEHEEALADYRKALDLDPEVVEGPGWLWRFMRNISEKPPTIRERADYIEAELQKAPEERKLRLAEEDEKQRMYKK